jgi:hypothetical protein
MPGGIPLMGESQLAGVDLEGLYACCGQLAHNEFIKITAEENK